MTQASILTALLCAAISLHAIEPIQLMPQPADSTQMWWAEGFPGHTQAAPWLRVIQTGRFGMALNTQTLRVEHFGPITSLSDDYRKLPATDLALSMTVDGKTYRATSGGAWSRWKGPRLIESGRFFQRADVTDLEFKAEDGARLNVEARLETAAWSDRLSLILTARPGVGTMPARDVSSGGNDTAAKSLAREVWRSAAMTIQFASATQTWELPKSESWADGQWHEVALVLDPVTAQPAALTSAVAVTAAESATLKARPIRFDPSLGWHCINLDGMELIPPPNGANPSNDAMERVKLVFMNVSDHEETARLMFEKTSHGIRQGMGSSITGVSAMLRDTEGNPTGIPVQLSKNWHNEPEGGVYSGQWFHGISRVRVPAKASIELELTLSYGHWGGVPAVSHSQLCLIGWGSNQLWDQSALGAWGESICYEPDQVQGQCTITDVRPAMVKTGAESKPWGWTGNVGGGDFFRLFNPSGERVPQSAMRTTYHKHGPCLTEVAHAGRIGSTLTHSITSSLARTGDLVRCTFRVRLDVHDVTEFSRLVLFQIGADTYNETTVRQMALGNESGLIREWHTQPGSNTYRTEPMECTGRIPWISLHEAETDRTKNKNAIANRGIVIREWKAKLGGKDAAPWIAERGLTRYRKDSSTLDLLPPSGVKFLAAGDFLETTIEFIIMPQAATDYYGPNTDLRAALTADANTWRMIQREAIGNDRQVEIKTGKLLGTHPALLISTDHDAAELTLKGGLGHVPITFTGLTSPRGHSLHHNGQPLNQSIHGSDFWQTDYDAKTQTWSHTYNVPIQDALPHKLRFQQ
jgi:hypothetical protein